MRPDACVAGERRWRGSPNPPIRLPETSEVVCQGVVRLRESGILATAKAGVQVLGRGVLEGLGALRLVADVNAVPPPGVEGLDARADPAELTPRVIGIGALAVGDLKMKVELELMRRLLEVLARTGWMDLPGGPSVVPAVPTPVTEPPTQQHIEREGAQTHIVLGAPTVGYGDRRRYAVTLVSLMLGGGMSSRLFQRVREELGLAYSVYTFQSYHHDTGVHGVYVGTSPETATRALDAIWSELSLVAREGFPGDEVESGKNQLKGQLTLSLESPASRMFRVAATELYDEPFVPLDVILARIDTISADDVAALCQAFFQPSQQTVVTLGRAEPA